MIHRAFRYHLERISRYFLTHRVAKLITVALFFLVFLAVALAVYFFIQRGFFILVQDPLNRVVLPFYILELFFLVLSYLIFISALVNGYVRLFRSDIDEWVIASPSFQQFPWYVMSRVFFIGLWPLLIIAFPAILALRSVFQLNLFEVFVASYAVLLLILIVTLIALILLFITGILLFMGEQVMRVRILRPSTLMGVMSLVMCGMVLYGWWQVQTLDIRSFVEGGDLSVSHAYRGHIVEQFQWFPSHLVAVLLIFTTEHHIVGMIGTLGATTLFVIALAVVYAMFSYTFLPLWQLLREGTERRAFKSILVRTTRQHLRFQRFFHGALGAIFEKELYIFFRDTRNILWGGFMLFLMAFQFGASFLLRRTILTYGEGAQYGIEFIQSLQFVALIFFMSAFVLRFAFPSLSTELKTAWILASAPISMNSIFTAKLTFFSILFFVISGIMVALHLFFSGFSVIAGGIVLLFAIIATLTITMFGMALGAVFPNFETDDPQVLSTSLPGLAFVAGSLLYGLVGANLLYHLLKGGGSQWMLVFLTCSIGIVVCALLGAIASMKKIEFIPSRF